MSPPNDPQSTPPSPPTAPSHGAQTTELPTRSETVWTRSGPDGAAPTAGPAASPPAGGPDRTYDPQSAPPAPPESEVALRSYQRGAAIPPARR